MRLKRKTMRPSLETGCADYLNLGTKSINSNRSIVALRSPPIRGCIDSGVETCLEAEGCSKKVFTS